MGETPAYPVSVANNHERVSETERHMMATDKTYSTMAEVRRANREAGSHFFDASTMRFFDSKIESGVLKGRFFITSEQFRGQGMFPDGKRLYTVRVAMPNGDIETVGEFQEYRTRDEAKAAVDRFAALRTCTTCGEEAPHWRTDHNYTLS